MSRNEANVEVIRSTLKEYPGSYLVRLKRGVGAAHLVWQNGDHETGQDVQVCIPLCWLENPSRRTQVEAATRTVAREILNGTRGTR